MNTHFASAVFALLTASSLSATITPFEYQSLISEFSGLHDTSFFPVAGKGFDDIESTFGTRIQISTQKYDFHRGIDVDGVEGDDILAVTDGVYWETRDFMGGGLTVILRHDFSAPVTLNGTSYNHYFTYYMHLFDDGIADNGIGTEDLTASWTSERASPGNGTQIAAGSHIGEMGKSGSSGGAAYSDHLHMELRVGTTNSLQFQTDNPNTTQHGFDPHLHPMLFSEPYLFGGPDNSPSLTPEAPHSPGDALVLNYTTNDEMPLLNRIEFAVVEIESGLAVLEHVLDLNLRTGFDATNVDALDTPTVAYPYLDPAAFGDTATEYGTNLVVPDEWLTGYGSEYRLETTAYDIWGNPTSLETSLIPEPRTYALLLGIAALLLCRARRAA